MNKKAGWIIGVISALLAVYGLTLPPDYIILDDSCALTDLQGRMSAAIYGDRFWKAQQDAVARAFRDELDLRAGAEKRRDQMNEQFSGIDRQMNRLSNQDVTGDADAALKAQKAEIGRMAWLSRCQQVIGQKLAH